MRARTQFWIIAGLVGLLSLWAIAIERLFPLVGAAGIAAWLLGQQFRFAQLAAKTTQSITVTPTVSRSQVTTNETTVVTVTVEATEPLPVRCLVKPAFPAGAEATASEFSIDRGEDGAKHSVEVRWPVAGTFTIEQPEFTMRDRFGLFEQSISIGATETIRVKPRAPRNIHVGEGGDQIAAGFGEHSAEQSGSGLEPEEVRKYVPGDTIRNIDWKATARLGEPHVREFEAETDRETILFVDHRASMDTGIAGETKLDYLRQVALAFVDSAQELYDPLGCYSVGDEGLTGSFTPSANTDRQLSIRHHLQSVETTSPQQTTANQRTPVSARQMRTVRQRLENDGSAYSERLTPFFDRPDAYVERIIDQPLVAAVQSVTSRLDGALWSIVLTDDERRAELTEAVKVARQGEGRVLVFIAPTVLYEPGGLSDLDEAYETYAAFEQFRTSLASMEYVSAFEVGPADRISAILASGQKQWTNTGGSLP